jgi:hypothetical protein
VPTVNPAGKFADPPPGPELVTVTVRDPETADDDSEILAWISVGLFTTVLFRVMSVPKLNEVTAGLNREPVTVILRTLPRSAFAGVTVEIVGAGLLTMNPDESNPVPPPGEPFVTVTSRPPAAAAGAIVMLALICVKLVTANEFTVMSEPSVNALVPAIYPVPVMSTSKVCPRTPLRGETLVSVGAGLLIANALGSVEVPPPGAGFVTDTLRELKPAPDVIVT